MEYDILALQEVVVTTGYDIKAFTEKFFIPEPGYFR